MLVIGDLGFSSLILAVCLVFPVVGFVLRRKWRISDARKEEIRRLLILASEEAARTELEDSLSYRAVWPSVSWPYHCAVCYCPTTTRCSRCKVVRYCSGKCQILHWRQGHKEECCPPDQATEFGSKSSFQEHYLKYGDKCQNGADQTTKSVESPSDEDTLFNSCSSAEELYSDYDKAKVMCSTGNSLPESSSTSFSGFSTSTAASESSDNISVSESVSSANSRKSEQPVLTDSAHETCGKNLNAVVSDSRNPLSPKFASLVDSVNGSTSSGTWNQSNSDHDNGQVQCRSTSLSFADKSSRCLVYLTKQSAVPDFCEGAVHATEQRDHAENCSASLSCGTNTKDASNSGSSLCFSFNMLGNNAPLLSKQFSEKASGDALPAEKCHDGSASPGKMRKGGMHSTDSPNMKYEKAKCADRGSTNDTSTGAAQSFKPRAVGSSSSHFSHASSGASSRTGVATGSGSVEANNLGHLPSSTNGTMYHVIGNKNRNICKNSVVLPSNALDSQAVSKSQVHSALHVKSGKADETAKHVRTSSLATGRSVNPRNCLKTSIWRVIDKLKGSVLTKQNQLEDPINVQGKCNEKGLFSYEVFIKLYMWKGVELHPCGLVNCGNSCYANAVLQCLAFTPPLSSYFLGGFHRKACRKRDWCFTCEFEGLVLKFKEGKSPVSPIGIISQLKSIGGQLGHGREEDAHEFLRHAIDKMQSVCLMESGKKKSTSMDEETTLIGLTFSGYFRSKIKCTRCHGRSERYERMMDLTVEIEGDIGTLEEALQQFTRTETLDGKNKYRCSRCKSYEKAKKKLTVVKAPNVLTIALKRFQSGKFGKLNKLIRFPESLDLTSFMSGTSDKPEYKLYGVIVHVDIMNAALSGHYVCYVKDSQNKWFKIDDSSVTPVEIDRVLSKEAYMLFYARSQPLDPKSTKNRAIPPIPVNKTMHARSCGKDPAQRFQHSNNSYSSRDQSYNQSMHQLQRTTEDSSSDNSSLFSSYSDEGSCSTASTQDSASFDGLSDYIFGDSSTLSSSLYSRYS